MQAGDGGLIARSRAVAADVVRLGWPVFVAQIAVMLYGVIDIMMAGHYGTTALAAAGIASSIYFSIFMATVGVLIALMPVASQLFGAGRHDEIGEQVRQTAWLGAFLMLPTVLLLVFPEPFFRLAKAPPEVEAIARAYLRAMVWAVPAAMLFRIFGAFSTAVSRPRAVMLLNLGGLALKLPLTWVFMYGRFGLPELGAVGCAVATAIVSWLTCIAAWWLVRRDASYARYAIFGRASRPDPASIGRLLAIGLPIGATFFIDVTAFTFMTLFIARLGPASTGAHQIAANVAALLFMLPLALGSAIGVLVGQAIGAGDPVRARATGLIGVGLGAGVGTVVAVALFVARDSVASAYTSDSLVRPLATSVLALVALYHWFDGLVVLVVNALRGYKRTLVPMVVSSVALWGLGLGGGVLLGLGDRIDLGAIGIAGPMGVPGFWLAAIASLFVAGVVLLGYFVVVSRPPRVATS